MPNITNLKSNPASYILEDINHVSYILEDINQKAFVIGLKHEVEPNLDINTPTVKLQDYLPSYDSQEQKHWIANYLHIHANSMSTSIILDILENKYTLVQNAIERLVLSFCGGPDRDYIKTCLNKAKIDLSNYGKAYYLFVLPWSNACANYYLIRANNENQAIEYLLDGFASDFSIDGEDLEEMDYIYNSEGIPCNIDNLSLLSIVELY
jgi:hypothetical protein